MTSVSEDGSSDFGLVRQNFRGHRNGPTRIQAEPASPSVCRVRIAQTCPFFARWENRLRRFDRQYQPENRSARWN